MLLKPVKHNGDLNFLLRQKYSFIQTLSWHQFFLLPATKNSKKSKTDDLPLLLQSKKVGLRKAWTIGLVCSVSLSLTTILEIVKYSAWAEMSRIKYTCLVLGSHYYNSLFSVFGKKTVAPLKKVGKLSVSLTGRPEKIKKQLKDSCKNYMIVFVFLTQ